MKKASTKRRVVKQGRRAHAQEELRKADIKEDRGFHVRTVAS